MTNIYIYIAKHVIFLLSKFLVTICIRMSLLNAVCNCTWCDKLFAGCDKLFQRKNRVVAGATASQIFSREGLAAVRPSISIPFGGKFESLDYEHSENSLFIVEQTQKGYRYITCLLITRYMLLVVIGFFTGLTGAMAEFGGSTINCYKNGFLRGLFLDDLKNDTYDAYLWGSLINGGLALVGSFLVVFIEPAATGGGIAGVLGYLNGVMVPKVVSFKVYLVKFVSLMCMFTSGLPGGKEGPMIHIGAILGASVPLFHFPFSRIRFFPSFVNDTERRDFAAAGVAAGLAAAFATPLGAMLVSVEEYISFWSGDLIFRIFVCSLISSTTFTYFVSLLEDFKGFFTSSHLLFLASLDKTHTDSYSFVELPVIIILGIVGGLLGSLWIYIHKIMILFRRRFIKFKALQVLEVVFWAVVVNGVTITLLKNVKYCSPIPPMLSDKKCPTRYPSSALQMNCRHGQMASFGEFTFHGGNNLFQFFMRNNEALFELDPMLIMFITYYTLSGFFGGSMISAGLFVPNMINGAIFGRVFYLGLSKIFHTYDLSWASGTRWAFYGSAAMLSSVVRLSFSLAVLYCEGASNTILFLPIVLVLIAVKLVSDVLIDSVYEVQYTMAYIPILSRYPPPVTIGLAASDVMSRFNVVYLSTPTTVRRLIQVSFETRHNGFPIVDTRFTTKMDIDGWPASVGRLQGIILRSQILIIMKNQWFDNPSTPQIAQQRLIAFRKDFADLLSRESIDTRPGMNMDAVVNLEAYMDASPFAVKGNTSLNRTYRIFTGIGLRHLIVVNNSYEVIGLITRKDLARFRTHYNIAGVHVRNQVFSL